MARTPAADPKDPRFRSFRVAAYSLYLVLVTVFSVLLIRSVVLSLRSMTPPPQKSQLAPLSAKKCGLEAQRLWNELDGQRRLLADSTPTVNADDTWTKFRTRWLGELRQIEAQCDLDSPERKELRLAFDLLVKAQDLYTTHAVQFAGEVGPTVDALNRALQAAHRAP